MQVKVLFSVDLDGGKVSRQVMPDAGWNLLSATM